MLADARPINEIPSGVSAKYDGIPEGIASDHLRVLSSRRMTRTPRGTGKAHLIEREPDLVVSTYGSEHFQGVLIGFPLGQTGTKCRVQVKSDA